VVHSRDDEVAHEIITSKKQPKFSQMKMGQHYLDKTKPKNVLKLAQMLSKSYYRI